MPILDMLTGLSPEMLAVGLGLIGLIGLKLHDKAVWSQSMPVSQPHKSNGQMDTTPWRKLVRRVIAVVVVGVLLFALVGVNSLLP